MSQKKSERQTQVHHGCITLPSGTESVAKEEIPELIADAKYSVNENYVVVGVDKQLAESEKRQPLEECDRDILHRVFGGIPPAEFPMSTDSWELYQRTFDEIENNPGWRICPILQEESESLRDALNWEATRVNAEFRLKELIDEDKIWPRNSITGQVQDSPDARVDVAELAILAAEFRVLVSIGGAVITAESTPRTTVVSDSRQAGSGSKRGRKPKDEAILKSVRAAAVAFCKSLPDASVWNGEQIIIKSQFIAKAFPNKSSATTSAARRTKDYSKNFGIARRTVLDIIRDELRAATSKSSAVNSKA
jgi:hypothetical protein